MAKLKKAQELHSSLGKISPTKNVLDIIKNYKKSIWMNKFEKSNFKNKMSKKRIKCLISNSYKTHIKEVN